MAAALGDTVLQVIFWGEAWTLRVNCFSCAYDPERDLFTVGSGLSSPRWKALLCWCNVGVTPLETEIVPRKLITSPDRLRHRTIRRLQSGWLMRLLRIRPFNVHPREIEDPNVRRKRWSSPTRGTHSKCCHTRFFIFYNKYRQLSLSDILELHSVPKHFSTSSTWYGKRMFHDSSRWLPLLVGNNTLM